MKRKQANTFQWSPDVRRVQSLNGGRFVCIGDHRGKWHQLAVSRDADDIQALLVDIGQADDELAGRIVADLVALDPVAFDWCTDLHANGYSNG
jgi:hypothetical protein